MVNIITSMWCLVVHIYIYISFFHERGLVMVVKVAFFFSGGSQQILLTIWCLEIYYCFSIIISILFTIKNLHRITKNYRPISNLQNHCKRIPKLLVIFLISYNSWLFIKFTVRMIVFLFNDLSPYYYKASTISEKI